MEGSLNDILPAPVDEETERMIHDLLRRKLTAAAGLTVRLLHAMEARFGPEVREVVDELRGAVVSSPRANPGEPTSDLQAFCRHLEAGCCGSHRWKRVIDEPDRVGYHFTHCIWAEVFRELGEPTLGAIFCAGDEPAVRAYNPALGFHRTQVLMDGDPCCDHVFFVRPADSSPVPDESSQD